MTATLPDRNVLIALAVADHVHHEAALDWFVQHDGSFATSPITQGTLLRLLIRSGVPAAVALEVLDRVAGHGRHEFWPDDRPYDASSLRGVVGHRQVTDGYLAALARTRGGRLVTFDKGLAVTHADVAELLDG